MIFILMVPVSKADFWISWRISNSQRRRVFWWILFPLCGWAFLTWWMDVVVRSGLQGDTDDIVLPHGPWILQEYALEVKRSENGKRDEQKEQEEELVSSIVLQQQQQQQQQHREEEEEEEKEKKVDTLLKEEEEKVEEKGVEEEEDESVLFYVTLAFAITSVYNCVVLYMHIVVLVGYGVSWLFFDILYRMQPETTEVTTFLGAYSNVFAACFLAVVLVTAIRSGVLFGPPPLVLHHHPPPPPPLARTYKRKK